MERTLIQDLTKNVGKEVLLQGWVQELRNLSKIKFIILRDRSGDMQTLAFKGETPDDAFNLIDTVTNESVVEIVGIPKENKESRWGIEVMINSIKVLSESAVPLPIDNSDKSQTNIDKRLDFRFLDTRNKKHHAIFTVRSKISKIVTNFLDGKGFTNINTPKITTLGVESGAELFKVDYFGKPIYLSQSPQIYKQMFVAGGFERVYEIAPVFRAEKSHTTRHLTEFTGVDFEMGFIKDETEIMDLIEEMFIDLVTMLKKEAGDELTLLGVEHTVPTKIPRMTMKEAKEMLKAKGRSYKDDDDLDPEGEKLLGKLVKKKFDSDFVFVTNFPWEIRPFYHMKPEDDPKGTKSFDLLFNGVEICTGAQREHRLDILSEQAKEKGMDMKDMVKYAEIFKYGCPPHGGVGFGLDRITQRLLQLDNIREAVLLPRDPERMDP
ncbi:aspartate--tRNA(Asn) ligase [Candidatus Woesearchaeota archaeon]|jgi:nondiscriminating aspartyl-tRNA synthetase|nr:aspartate--tRNA(Asn) ligase [Candidatus Woesearchaeota archaeon]MBT5396754.1 aspartate--tRNA(Asn) ligase [Candidatus Woesearchaeota archaeon]MBT5924714.1 aspartate--tRNA(Asn) ligase [Candidatus Woesearchaeota archaeon]MBT6367642.1 aspartate--tRNA(Asn) ligase [Candidatus Woesearchaeota archaeon]MBT7762957.1 aspartate--tRNA(Asn) ligase [Candidatus Woesearchaeota archaeon]